MKSLNEIVKKYLDTQKTGNTNVLASLYQELVKARNALAVTKGFRGYVDMQVNGYCHISKSDWEIYLSSKDDFATKFSPRLKNSFNSPHFLSKLPELEIKYPEGVFDLIAKKYPEINENKHKITIEESDKEACFRYSKENDHYSIFIPQANFNQKVSMLIHELAHIFCQERTDNREYIYTMELEAHRVEFELAKDISEKFLNAVIGEYLMCLVKADFQISMFENPEQDPVSTYSKFFEKYIGKLKPGNQTDFLFDKKITHDPLVDLSDAVSIVNLLK